MAASNPAATEQNDVTHTAGRMSSGAELPSPARIPATVAGISCTEAVFSTTKRHSSSEASARPSAIRTAARMPMGVAALPSPSKLADTLALRAARVSRSCQAFGKSRERMGESSRDSFSEAPLYSISRETPHQRHIGPAMESASVIP